MATIETNDQDFDRDVLEASKETGGRRLVGLWCGPCKMISEPSKIKGVSDKVSIVKCNIDENLKNPQCTG